MVEEKSKSELEKELKDKKQAYVSLLKENHLLYSLYLLHEIASFVFSSAVILAIISPVIGMDFLPLCVIVAVVFGPIFYICHKHFRRSFEKMASNELKEARKKYDECDEKIKQVEKADKEKRTAEQRKELQRSLEELQSNENLSACESEEDDADNESWEEIVDNILTAAYGPETEILSYHAIYTGNLSDSIDKNTLIAKAYLGKVIMLGGGIKKINYDKQKKMPYALVGSGHYLPSGVCDRYACYFSDPKQVEILTSLQSGDTVLLVGIFSENEYDLPSSYILLNCYFLSTR